jgi:hypothetical protein
VARSNAPRVLVLGAQRSGTTWTAQILGATRGAQLFVEPDNCALSNYALKAACHLGFDPVLGADDVAPTRYEHLWRALFDGGRPRRVRGGNWIARRLLDGMTTDERWAVSQRDAPRLSPKRRLGVALSQAPRVDPARPVVVKSVNANLALDWVVTRWRPTPVWVRRHPLDAVASRLPLPIVPRANDLWRELQAARGVPPWCPPPPEDHGRVPAAAWLTGLMSSTCQHFAASNDDVIVVHHEALCRDPMAEFPALAHRVGLEWTDRAEAVLAASNQPGEGWSTQRVAAEQPGRWRTRLTAEEQELAATWLAKFPIAEDYPELASIR